MSAGEVLDAVLIWLGTNVLALVVGGYLEYRFVYWKYIEAFFSKVLSYLKKVV